VVVDLGSSAYSSLQFLGAEPSTGSGVVAVLYERAECEGFECPLIFLPDHISFVNVTL